MTYAHIVRRFEWDEKKREQNIAKHGLDFLDAVLIFDDPNRIDRVDSRKDYKEFRHQTLGKISIGNLNLIIFVAWTHRGSSLRIISARPAHSKERWLYNEKQNELG